MSNVIINIDAAINEKAVFDNYGIDAVFEKGSSYEELMSTVEFIAESVMESAIKELSDSIENTATYMNLRNRFLTEAMYLVTTTQFAGYGMSLLENASNRQEVISEMAKGDGRVASITDGETTVINIDRLMALDLLEKGKGETRVALLLNALGDAKTHIESERELNEEEVKLFNETCQPVIDKMYAAIKLVIRGVFSS